MTKVLIIVDKFKGSLTAREASSAIARGLLSAVPDLDIEQVPLADGGEGTLEAVEMFGDERILVNSIDPLGRKIEVPVLRTGERILCEMAKSTGLHLLSKEERNPINTTSYGLGMVFKEVAQMGYKSILMGIGGSATNDAGTGMLEALGYHFVDSEGNNSRRGSYMTGADLINIAGIDDTSVPAYIRKLKIEVACDVRNPLTGPCGASHVYGPQKGASVQDIESLESGMQNFVKVVARYLGRDLSDIPGAGAAGGVGYALAAFMDAKLLSGWRVLFDFLDIESKIEQADVVITGEGRVDLQSISGKLLDGVVEICLRKKRRLWVICGDNKLPDRDLERIGVERLFSVSQFEPSKERAIANADYHIEKISQLAATFLKPPTSNRQTIKIK
ncbi:MAG: glycerate kinase [Bacteroidales bacterium]|nr:glycerate kinase [Bacteroidales bacterium]MDZ4058565.1 glycerate kinase [Bacteroidales bacterium]